MYSLLRLAMPAIFIFFSTVVLQAQQPARMTLEEAIQYAQTKSLAVKNAELNVNDADWLIKENKASGLPQIKAGVNLQRFLILPKSVLPESFAYAFIPIDSVTGLPVREPTKEDRTLTFGLKNNFTGSVEASQLIFSGSYTVAQRASKAYRELSTEQLEVQKQTLRYQVTEAYLPALLIQESLQTIDRNIANLEKLFNETKAMRTAGFVEQLDVDRLELSISNLRTERENLARQREIVINAFKFVISYPQDQPLELADNIQQLLADANEDDLVGAINFSARREHVLANMGIKLNELNIDLNRASGLPTVAAFGSFQESLTGDNVFKEGFFIPTSIIGLSASVSIFDGNSRKSKIQRAIIATEIARNQKTDLERVITLQVQNARIAYQNAASRIESQRSNIALAERIYNTTQVKYKEGVGSSLEINMAEQSLYQAQQNMTQALYDLLVAKKALDKALGK